MKALNKEYIVLKKQYTFSILQIQNSVHYLNSTWLGKNTLYYLVHK